MPQKTECSVSRSQFVDNATALKVVLHDQTKVAEVKEFSTGSFGWSLSDKIVVMIDGKPVKVMVNLNLIVVGSKDAAD